MSDLLAFGLEASANPVHRAFQASLFTPADPHSHYLQGHFNVYLKRTLEVEGITSHPHRCIPVRVPKATQVRAVDGGVQADVRLLYAVNERGSHTQEAYWTQYDEMAAEEVREKCRRAEEGWVEASEEWYLRQEEAEPRVVRGGGGRRRSGWGQSASAQSNYEDPDRTETENSDDDEEMPA